MNTCEKKPLPSIENPYWHRGILAGLICIFLVMALPPILTHSVTEDEMTHIPTGYAQAYYGFYHMDNANPPLVRMLYGGLVEVFKPQVYWGPDLPQIDFSIYSYYFAMANIPHYHLMGIFSRMVIMLLTLIGGILVYRWAKEEYGPWAGLGCLALFFLNPVVIAHGTLATLDMGLTLAWIAYLYAIYQYLKQCSWKWALLSGLFLGLALCSKFTSVLLIPLTLGSILLDTSTRQILMKNRKKTFLQGLGFLWVSVLTINLIYRFTGTLTPISQFHFISPLFQSWSKFIPGWLAIPFPVDFVNGFDKQFSDLDQYANYLNGTFSSQGFYSYYLEAFLIKNPIPFLIMLGWAGYWRYKKHKPLSLAEKIWLLAAGGIFLVFSLSRTKNLGIRYILPAYPFLILLVGPLFARISNQDKGRWKWMVGGLFLWQIASMVWICPHYLSYFNELIGGPSRGHFYLLDSNLDWGQDSIRLKKYMDSHGLDSIMFKLSGIMPPIVYGIQAERVPETPTPGVIAMSVNHYYGAFEVKPENRHKFDWLKDYQPVDTIGYSIWIYKITPEDIMRHQGISQ